MKDKPVLLIVDDEAELRSSMRFDAESEGYTVIEAGSGTEALEVIRRDSPGMVISDIRMPNGDGIFLLKSVKTGPGVILPVLLVSGYADTPIWDVYNYGAEAFLGKPFLMEQLRQIVELLTCPIERRWEQQDSGNPGSSDSKHLSGSQVKVAIGRGGMYVDGTEFTGLRRDSLLTFDLNISTPFRCPTFSGTAAVRWSRDYPIGDLGPGLGVEFLALSTEARKCMHTFIATDFPVAYIPRVLDATVKSSLKP